MIKEFEGFITSIGEGMAYATLIDDKGEKSYINVKLDELKANNVECKAGTIFLFFLNEDEDSVEIKPIERTHISTEEFDALLKYYEDRYGDV